MPIYVYECPRCDFKLERNVPIAERDEQWCECDGELFRKIAFSGLTWAPTAGGMR